MKIVFFRVQFLKVPRHTGQNLFNLIFLEVIFDMTSIEHANLFLGLKVCTGRGNLSLRKSSGAGTLQFEMFLLNKSRDLLSKANKAFGITVCPL